MRMFIAVFAALAACSKPAALTAVRFHNRAPVWQVNDRLDTEEPPEQFVGTNRYFLAAHYLEPIDRYLAFENPRPAQNINSLGEVPDSTWYVNRAGIRELTVTEMRRGPNATRGPDRGGPWKVLSTKTGGSAVGFLVEDVAGERYLLKFDTPGLPEAETAAEVVSQRLLWALGYHVPENDVVEFAGDQLVLADDAVIEDRRGHERPMTIADLRERLALVDPLADGRFRALSSKLLPGKPIGGFLPTGTRPGDPNDRVPHELRRDQRGLCVAMAWLNHGDIKPQNTLDVWVRDPALPNRRYLVHYLLDFGKTLGVFGKADARPSSGYRYAHDLTASLQSLVSLGLWRQPWEHAAHYPELPGVGFFDSETFTPSEWKPHYTWRPCQIADRWDRYWAAKTLLRLTPELIRAAVEEGRYSDPRAVAYLSKVLVERQRKIGRAYLQAVTPLDDFAVAEDAPALCFRDLWLVHGLGQEPTRYSLTSFDQQGRRLGTRRATADNTGRSCVAVQTAEDGHGYTIVSIATRRGSDALPLVRVHLARNPATGTLRVIGLERE